MQGSTPEEGHPTKKGQENITNLWATSLPHIQTHIPNGMGRGMPLNFYQPYIFSSTD